MDSGSGSLQSSSGGDEEYDSNQQPQLFPPPPVFFNSNNIPPLSSHIIPSSSSSSSSSSTSAASSSMIHHHQQPLPFHLSHHNYQNHLQLHPPPFYDFPSNYNFNPDSSNPTFVNLDLVRPNPTTLRSEPTDFKNPPPSDGSTQNQIPAIRSTPSSSGVLPPKVTTKKRTRASRRAPTTVLTTDTTNFRAMVQEFTGIPSPPFTPAGSSYSRRFDLFGLVRTTTTTTSSATNLEASGSGLYPSRSNSKVQLFSSMNEDNVVVGQGHSVPNLQQAEAGIFSFQSLSGHDFNSKGVAEETHLGPPHIHGSTTSQQLLSALQNDETWRGNGGGTAATAAAAAAVAAATRSNNNNNNAANCKLNFTGSSSSSDYLQRDKGLLLGNIVSTTTRGESTVDSWICPSD